MDRRTLIILIIGAAGGFLAAAFTRLYFELPVGLSALGAAWVGMATSVGLGMLALFVPVQMMGQSSPQFARRTVIIVLAVASVFIGAIACGGVLLYNRIANYEFFQGVSLIEILLAVVTAAALNVGAFFLCIPIRGFDYDREESEAPERFKIKIKSETLEKLRGPR